ncbi:hypothetical protein ACGFYY_35385 [Streptomyces sp. NPDC048331]|uniref:hypothetical protein n=1 Tax=Streptomyces sp. NPDC048331 TaxID=3365534 RepID=UPI0037100D08
MRRPRTRSPTLLMSCASSAGSSVLQVHPQIRQAGTHQGFEEGGQLAGRLHTSPSSGTPNSQARYRSMHRAMNTGLSTSAAAV